ncbi:2-dehydropantoate 2-reductase [Lipingzhangella halophila]|uniref:2-dehydropantoate 2-reductase n=1 Tax=Lipingzhangella halophila TaxID=1783352 RepID=A0A7W7RI68_9ACTN|nr:2-dehydropantoate 2-reductase [Lipingzhangella halophila]
MANESTAAHIAAEGIRVESDTFGGFSTRVTALPSLEHSPDASGGHGHVVFVTPKATALGAALDRVNADALASAVVVPLLNGFEHMEVLRRRFPAAYVTGAAIHVGAARVAPGHIHHTSPYTWVEIADSDAPADRIAELTAALRGTGIGVELGASEGRVLWEKYGFLLPTALVCAHSGLPIGRARVDHRADMLSLVAEVTAVADARGVPLDTERIIAMADDRPADTKPSMLFDRETGRPMELDPLGGALLRAGERAGVDTPVTARMVADLERINRAATPAAP